MRKVINCNTGWTFHECFSADLAAAFAKGAAVDLPQVRRLAREIFAGSMPTMALVGPVAAAPTGEDLTRHLRARG